MYNLLIFGLVAVFITGIYFTNDAFGFDFNNIDVTSSQTLLFEGTDTNVIVVKMKIVNNSNEEFGGWIQNYLVSSTGAYYEESNRSVPVGDRICPSSEDIPAGVTKEVTFCYDVPKNLLTSFSLKILDKDKDTCADHTFDAYTDPCQEITTAIKNPIKTDYNEYKKSFISTNTEIDAKFKSVDLIEQDEFNVLKVDFTLTNLSPAEINYSPGFIIVITPDGTEYTASSYDLTSLGYDYNSCQPFSIDINPKLTKPYSYCYEVPQEFRTFDLSIRNGDFGNCDSTWYQCSEYLLNISNPKFIELATPELPTSVEEPEPISEPTPVTESKELGMASFVDPTKDPQSYVDRYNNEPKYKEWFDENYSEYSSIYEAVGLEEPTPEPTPEPTSESCGSGTELVNGICQVIKTEKTSESKGGGCLIATATYGSELAPQVQQLRELRDNSLLQTESGKSFMSSFNDLYYSFSPTVADWERENPAFKEIVKITLTPMISSLSILNYVDMDSEVSVLGYGVSLILLNVGMYFLAPGIVIHSIRTRL